MVISAKDVEIVASSDSSITSKARGSNKVKGRVYLTYVPHPRSICAPPVERQTEIPLFLPGLEEGKSLLGYKGD